MRYVILLLVVGAVVGFFLWRRRKKKFPVESPIQQQTLSLRLLSQPPETMRIGEQYQVLYELVYLPSGAPASAIVNWRTGRDPRAPVGGPDVPCLYIDAGGKITALDAGERTVYAAFSDTPEERAVAFKIRVI